ncbi:hypothetical protein HAX54_037542 [Datura stramonium]|uniref:Uncharacterized protein n=1 Tax=Datura stramonium TaxID=4076 RepID=A0ABS8VK26_DATST|nr:hypothetical protein [Datura stramonium]
MVNSIIVAPCFLSLHHCRLSSLVLAIVFMYGISLLYDFSASPTRLNIQVFGSIGHSIARLSFKFRRFLSIQIVIKRYSCLKLVETFGFEHINAGDLLREEMYSDTKKRIYVVAAAATSIVARAPSICRLTSQKAVMELSQKIGCFEGQESPVSDSQESELRFGHRVGYLEERAL